MLVGSPSHCELWSAAVAFPVRHGALTRRPWDEPGPVSLRPGSVYLVWSQGLLLPNNVLLVMRMCGVVYVWMVCASISSFFYMNVCICICVLCWRITVGMGHWQVRGLILRALVNFLLLPWPSFVVDHKLDTRKHHLTTFIDSFTSDIRKLDLQRLADDKSMQESREYSHPSKCTP